MIRIFNSVEERLVRFFGANRLMYIMMAIMAFGVILDTLE